MSVREENVRLIFGLKVRQLRLDHHLSPAELAHKTGLSVSYLNEIEKGKKYPKADKVISLAQALAVPYDWLVSLALPTPLQPLSELLEANLLQQLPLQIFGIGPGELLELLASVPQQLGAFINTLLKISRNFHIRKEEFFFAVLRSYQEMHDNYFEELEAAVESFCQQEGIALGSSPDHQQLAAILTRRFGYRILTYSPQQQARLQGLRSVLVSEGGPTLLLHPALTDKQRAFTLGREIAYQVLGLQDRPLTSSWIEVDSFAQVLHNFQASYFAGALLIHRQHLVGELQRFFALPRWQPSFIVELMEQFNASSEIFLHRMTNLLPRYFGLNRLFFLRFDNVAGADYYTLTKEIHLSGLHTPHATTTESYCRRWVSLTILQELAAQQRAGTYQQPLCRAHISQYIDSKAEYLVLSIARPTNLSAGVNTSVSVGMLMTDVLKQQVRFWRDPALHIKLVNQTCERCGAVDCSVRVAEPVILRAQQANQHLQQYIRDLQAGVKMP